MDVCGDGRLVGRAELLELARQGGVDATFTRKALDRVLTAAGSFIERAKLHPIRLGTAKSINAAVEKALSRMR